MKALTCEHYVSQLKKPCEVWNICSHPGCSEQSTHLSGYLKSLYWGTSTPVRNTLCAEHAKEFSEKYKLELTP